MDNNCNFFNRNKCCTVKGDKGEKGEIGFTGMQGNKGEKGIKGQKGEEAKIPDDINITSLRVNEVRITDKLKLNKLSGPYELGVTRSNKISVNSNLIPSGSSLTTTTESNYKNYNLGEETNPWFDAHIFNIKTNNIITRDISINVLGANEDDENNIFINGNLIPNNNGSLGSRDTTWDNLYIKDISASKIFVDNIQNSNIYTDEIKTQIIYTQDISASRLNTDKIIVSDVDVDKLNVLFDISANEIISKSVSTNDISGVKLNISEIKNDISNNIIINSTLIPDNSNNFIGTPDKFWEKAYFKEGHLNKIVTDSSSNNIFFDGNIIPSGEKNNTTNIVNNSIGNNENIVNEAFINNISVNKIEGLSDSSNNKEVIIDGDLIPGPSYDTTGKSNYSLGSETRKWKDLYLSDKALHLGDAKVTINENIQDNVKTVELKFVPNNGAASSSISVARGKFNIITQIIDGVEKEVLVPIDDTFSRGSILELEDINISKNDLKDGDIIRYDEETEGFIIGETSIANNAGQSFLQILTEQPQKFNNVSSNFTSGTITMNWNYEDIIVKYDDNTNRLFASGDTLKEKMLPYIDKIHVDISGIIHGISGNILSNTWIPYEIGDYINNGDRIINNDESYNTSEYKELVVNKTQLSNIANPTIIQRILSEPESLISFRIYGKNNSKDTNELQNERALYFNNLKFLLANPPKRPIYISDEVILSGTDKGNIKLKYKTEQLEEGNAASEAKLANALVIYNEIERLTSVSANIPLIQTEISSSYSFNPFIDKINTNGESPPIEMLISNTREGTRYKYTVQFKNNLINTFSTPSIEYESTLITPIPESIISQELFFSIGSEHKKNVIISGTSTNIIYVNYSPSDTSVAFIVETSNNPNTNFSNNTSIELSSDYRFGKNLDISGQDIININVNVDSTNIQNVKFNGFVYPILNTIDTTRVYRTISTSTNATDMFNTDNKKGFRLKGNIITNNILVNQIRSVIGNPRVEPYVLKYEYIRKGKLYENNQDVVTNNSFNIYVDNLQFNPSILTRNEPNITVTQLKYCMGIPSVYKFDVNFNSTLSNSSRVYRYINSQYNYVRGDRKIADIKINTLDNVTIKSEKTQKKNILLNISDISSNGTYGLNSTNFQSSVSNYFKNIEYSNSNFNNNNRLSIAETVFSLKISDNGLSISPNQEIILNHFCDRNSFNSNFNRILTISIYELVVDSNIFSSNISNLTINNYNNHNNLVRDSTLLFIDGKFQTYAKRNYPNISLFTYQNQNLSNTVYTQNMGLTAYAIDGTINGVGKKYKWIGFNLSTTIGSDGTTFVDIYTNLRGLFNADTFDKLKVESDKDVIGFIKVGHDVGNLSRDFNKLSPWYSTNGQPPPAISLSDMFLNANKGTLYTDSASSKWGPVVNSSNTLDIFIFIGLNNSIEL